MSRVLSPAQRKEALVRLLTDFEVYAPRVLQILPKIGGSTVPFHLNAAQKYFHQRLEEQRKSTGKVRALALKGRQQGISTYTEGRLYKATSTQRGVKAYILTHEQKATENMFAMVRRFYDCSPPELRPHVGASNAKELFFDLLMSRYELATAGTKDTGRSGTAQFFHGSEVAFWPNAHTHFAGIGQTIADAPGTEIILESTANGTANVWHELWQAAVQGDSEFLPIFIPWFWQVEYRRPAPVDLELTQEESDYQETFGLSLEQMAWRANKIGTDFRGDVSLFDQEYPASPELAFASSSPRALIQAMLVIAARKARDVEAIGPNIMAIDPAEYGDDSTAIWRRRGRVARRLARWNRVGTMETAGRAMLIADKEKPDVIFVDATGVGTGVADRMKEEGYPVVRVHFGEAATQDDLYVTRRDELWGDMRDWFADRPVSIEDDNDVAAQLTSVQYGYDSKRRIKLEPKEKMKERGLKSPDDADALALTFARGGTGSSADAQAYRRLRGR